MRTNKYTRRAELIRRLSELGFSLPEIERLRRIQMTLHRWAEAECNGEIERDETTGRPFRNSQAWINGMTDKRIAWPVPDREAGALRRLAAIMAAHPALWFYHQTDPRGCALYVGRLSHLSDVEGRPFTETIRRDYHARGVAVCD